MMMTFSLRAWMSRALALSCWVLATAGASSSSLAADFSGKTVEILIGFGPGGGHDAYGRALGQFLGHHLPGRPSVVVRNMPGAGSLTVLNHIASVAPPNGLTLGTFDPQLLIAPLLGDPNARYDVRKIKWIGSIVDGTNVCLTWTASGITTWVDLMSDKPISFGSTGPAAALYQHTAILQNMFGSKVKMVSGYKGTAEVRLAMERGEITGNCGDNWASLKSTAANLLAEKKISIPVQFAVRKHPELPDVPLILDMAKSDEDKAALKVLLGGQATGRPYAAPPGTPDDIVEALRDGFDATMKDPEFVQFADKMRLDLQPVHGADMTKLLDDIYRTSPAAVARAKAVIK
jgi:tripartite-type tricarboxylate transporter receptor subunit TctC